MSGVQKSIDVQAIKTRQIVVQEPSGSFPAVNSLLTVRDGRGHTEWTTDVTVDSLTANTVVVNDELDAVNIVATNIATTNLAVTNLAATNIAATTINATEIDAADLYAEVIKGITGTFDSINADTLILGATGAVTYEGGNTLYVNGDPIEAVIGLTGTNYSDYIYWNPTSSEWNVETSGKVHFGIGAGETNQGISSIAIGQYSGQSNQLANSIAIGTQAGSSNQSGQAIAIGVGAGSVSQGPFTVAIGFNAGNAAQGINSIAIGAFAGLGVQHANTVIINGNGIGGGSGLNSTGPNSFYISPIRNFDNSGLPGILRYNPTTLEVVYDTTTTLTSGIATISNPSVNVTVTGVSITSSPIIQLTFFNDGLVGCQNPVNPADGNRAVSCWYNYVSASSFQIEVSITPVVGQYFKIVWSIIKP